MRQLTTLQVIAVLALGVSLGYIVAANRSGQSCASEHDSSAPPTLSDASDCGCFDEMAMPTMLAMTDSNEQPKNQEILLAQATPKASSPAPANGKKPNILFIMIFRRIGIDPGYASSPFVATFVDVTGIVIYFNIAQLWLGL